MTARNNITSIENKRVVTSEVELAKNFKKYFVVPKLGIKTVLSSTNYDSETENLFAIVKKCKNNSSITGRKIV